MSVILFNHGPVSPKSQEEWPVLARQFNAVIEQIILGLELHEMEEHIPSMSSFYTIDFKPVEFYRVGTDFMTNQPKYRVRNDYC